jgi:hypothetical protein
LFKAAKYSSGFKPEFSSFGGILAFGFIAVSTDRIHHLGECGKIASNFWKSFTVLINYTYISIVELNMTRSAVKQESRSSHDGSNHDAASISSHTTNGSATATDNESPIRARFTADNHQHDAMSDPGNFEDEPKNPVPGWPQVAELMSNIPDFASFNRFSVLQIKSLLYYQAELEILKAELREEELEDYRRGDERAIDYAKRADFLVRSRNRPNHRQWEVVVEIRRVLKEYSTTLPPLSFLQSLTSCTIDEALLQFSQVSALQQPEGYNVDSLRTWLRHPEAGNLCIGGKNEHNTWGDLYAEYPPSPSLPQQFWLMIWRFFWASNSSSKQNLDLASCMPPRKVDGFSRWVATSFIPFWDNVKEYREERKKAAKEKKINDVENKSVRSALREVKQKSQAQLEEETLTYYSENNIMRFTSSVSTVAACLLPTIAITVLSQLHETKDLLLCLAGFATVFAIGLIFLGTATRVEIFGATAA